MRKQFTTAAPVLAVSQLAKYSPASRNTLLYLHVHRWAGSMVPLPRDGARPRAVHAAAACTDDVHADGRPAHGAAGCRLHCALAAAPGTAADGVGSRSCSLINYVLTDKKGPIESDAASGVHVFVREPSSVLRGGLVAREQTAVPNSSDTRPANPAGCACCVHMLSRVMQAAT